jgi:quinol-cytochrome oxidoreductase complex cytochrome b subunit
MSDSKSSTFNPKTAPRFSEIATFMRCALADSPEDIDIALIGVPYDGGVTNRPGARHGPREIRNSSSLIRGIHHWSASAIVVLVGLHALRVFFMASYKYPREFSWVLGVFLFLLVMFSAFTGYLLPWDQKALWGTNIATGIAAQVPLIGGLIQKVLIGGGNIGAVTLTRFYTFHVGVVPPLVMLIAAVHVFLVIKQGISAPPKR